MPGRRQVPGPRYEALLQLLRTAEALWESSRLFFERWDLGPSQFNLLNLLNGSASGLSQNELSRQLIMHRSNVTGLVNRLEARKLLKRQKCAEDRRAYRVELTADGRQLLKQILPHFYATAETVWGDIPVKRVQSVLAELQQLKTNAEEIARTSSEP